MKINISIESGSIFLLKGYGIFIISNWLDSSRRIQPTARSWYLDTAIDTPAVNKLIARFKIPVPKRSENERWPWSTKEEIAETVNYLIKINKIVKPEMQHVFKTIKNTIVYKGVIYNLIVNKITKKDVHKLIAAIEFAKKCTYVDRDFGAFGAFSVRVKYNNNLYIGCKYISPDEYDTILKIIYKAYPDLKSKTNSKKRTINNPLQ